jgi:hypothetical protein
MRERLLWFESVFIPGCTSTYVGLIPATSLKSRPFLGICPDSHRNGVQGVAGSNPAVPIP